ncbi:MAG: hypothetical protein KF774_08125 [Planctomyces sp.]|nr:hypothetical protein [Planctomyces sp.]
MLSLSRRRFLATAAASLPLLRTPFAHARQVPRPKVAFVITACFHRSHAHVLLENFLEPYLFSGQLTEPLVETVALYGAQFPANDTLRQIAADYKLPLYDTIEDCLCLGGQELAVDGVVSIGEHGEYPENELGQQMYPRKEFFDAITGVFRKSGRSVPVFNDKHLSYRFDWAKEMVDVSRELEFPFLAGSSVPLAQRIPELELPDGARIEEAVSIHGGPAERYGFHGLEVLQSIVESRAGGETGIARVTALSAEQLRGEAGAGRWSPELALAAMRAEYASQGVAAPNDPLADLDHGFLVEYVDGLRGVVLKVGSSGIRWNFACQVAGEADPRACAFYPGPWNNRSLFRALAHAIQVLIVEKRAPYPVERTLMTTGALDAAMHSLFEKGRTIETPELHFAYQPAADWDRVRENGETWRTITPDTPEPMGMKRDPAPAA